MYSRNSNILSYVVLAIGNRSNPDEALGIQPGTEAGIFIKFQDLLTLFKVCTVGCIAAVNEHYLLVRRLPEPGMVLSTQLLDHCRQVSGTDSFRIRLLAQSCVSCPGYEERVANVRHYCI
jgi:hypothetical protein